MRTMAFLTPLMIPGSEAIYFDYSTPESRDESVRRAFAEPLAGYDHIFAQLASFTVTNERELRERFGAKVVTIANFYFRGLFPDSCYIGGFGDRIEEPTSVNSVVILDAFLRGESKEAAARSFTRENYERLGLLDAWALSLAEMHRREADRAVEVPGTELMEASCLRYPAFTSMNHPSIVLLADYLHLAFDYAGIAHREINAATYTDPLDIFDTTPIDDIMAEVQQLPYRGIQHWRLNTLNRRFIDRTELVERVYDVYREFPRDRLVINSPTDLVDRYKNDPQLRFLVDPTVPIPSAPISIGSGKSEHFPTRRIEGMLDAILSKSEEVRLYTHKLHSFGEIADPKIEAMRHVLIDLRRSTSAAEAESSGQILEAIHSYRQLYLIRIPGRIRHWLVILLLTFAAALGADILTRLVPHAR